MDPTATKYLIKAKLMADGIVDKPDVVGAIFGQTEGLLGDELDLRDLQKSGRIGRIEVDVQSKSGKSEGIVLVSSSLDQVETAILASALETIDRVGPCKAGMRVLGIEDVRVSKREQVVERAKELLNDLIKQSKGKSSDLTESIRQSIQVEEITTYGKDHCPAGPAVKDSEAIIIVEGRSDVLNLLRAGVKNAIAVEGTNIPETVQELSRERVATAFVDGDRGGELILRELFQVAEVDFVARAPRAHEVEELSPKQLTKCLRNKVPYDQYMEMNKLNAPDDDDEPRQRHVREDDRRRDNNRDERRRDNGRDNGRDDRRRDNNRDEDRHNRDFKERELREKRKDRFNTDAADRFKKKEESQPVHEGNEIVETTIVVEKEPEVVEEPVVEEPEVIEEKPKRTRKTKVVEEEPEVEESVVEEKPKRTRKTKKSEEDSAEDVEEKPKRTRKTKVVEEEPVVEEPVIEEPEVVEEKPKTIRSKKRDAARQTKTLSPEQQTYRDMLLDMASTHNAKILNSNNEIIREIAVKSLVDSLKSDSSSVCTIVFDGVISQRILDVSSANGIQTIVGTRKGNITKMPAGITIWTKEDLY
ncbi:MAG: DNA primase DnaG [Methanomassiliicoccales archaeon]|nr:DNA primase DnaG [Methanomassiliicoccales archaeon]